MTPEPDRLFGIPGAEQLHLDLVSCYESDVDPWVDEPEHAPKVIEEWTVRPVVDHVPKAEVIIDEILEWIGEAGELDEYGFEAFSDACHGDDVKEAVEAVRVLIGSKVRYRMAEKLVAEHKVTWTADGEPLIDGEPLYVKG